jgi:hypothetical protein
MSTSRGLISPRAVPHPMRRDNRLCARNQERMAPIGTAGDPRDQPAPSIRAPASGRRLAETASRAIPREARTCWWRQASCPAVSRVLSRAASREPWPPAPRLNPAWVSIQLRPAPSSSIQLRPATASYGWSTGLTVSSLVLPSPSVALSDQLGPTVAPLGWRTSATPSSAGV